MLDRLKTVYGAVQERELLSALSHFCIYNGRVQGTNGRMAIDAAIPELAGLEVVVPADRFLAAVEASADDAKITLEDGRLIIRAGRFRAKVPSLAPESFPRVNPDPSQWELEEELLPTLRRLRPFMANDATNIWATSMLFTEAQATVTNNVVLAAEKCTMLAGTGIANIAVPGWALDEIIRIGEEPSGFGVTDSSITFYFGETWIKTQLILAPWPIAKVIELVKMLPKKMPETPEGLTSAVGKITPFCKDPKFPVIMMQDDGVTTEDFDHQAEVRGMKLPVMKFNANMLNLVLSKADHFVGIDADRAAFMVGPARGIIMGLRQ